MTKPSKNNRQNAQSANTSEKAAKAPPKVKNNLSGKSVADATRKAKLRKQLADALQTEVNSIVVGALQWSVSVALSMLELMQGEGVQRPVQWSHAATLAESMREAVKANSVRVRWFDGTTLGVIASNDNGIDSRHRNIAYVLAFGTAEELDDLMRIVECHPTRPANLDPEEYLIPPVKGWVVNHSVDGTGKSEVAMEPPAWCLPVSIGADPESFAVLDADAKKRTGADTLVTSADSSKILSKSGIEPATMQKALRACYLRCLPSIDKETEEIKPGSLRRGGSIHNQRYLVFSEIFGKSVAAVHDIIEETFTAGQEKAESQPKFDYDATVLDSLGYHNILAVCTLHYIQFEDSKAIVAFVDSLCTDSARTAKTPAAYLANYLEGKTIGKKEKRNCFKVGKGRDMTFLQLKSAEVFTGLVAAITRSGDTMTQAEFIKLCQDEAATLIPGRDTDGFADGEVEKAEKKALGHSASGGSAAGRKIKRARKGK